MVGSTKTLTRDLANVLKPVPKVYSKSPSAITQTLGAKANAMNEIVNRHRLSLASLKSFAFAGQQALWSSQESIAGRTNKK